MTMFDPPLPHDKPYASDRSRVVTLRLEPGLYEQLIEATHFHRRTLSSLIRDYIITGLRISDLQFQETRPGAWWVKKPGLVDPGNINPNPTGTPTDA